jgi:scyllo-inositol 2-dehydrogenase (NADP+)
MGNEKAIRAAVIGYGGAFNMGKGHADWMREAGIETVAVCDVDSKRLEAAKAELPGVRTYLDYRELAKDPDVDLCVIILPHNLHAESSVCFSKAGKHVVVEKPMCITVAEADAMIDAAKSAGKMLSIFHNRRHDGDYLTIKETIDQGLIGEVFHIEAGIGGYDAPRDWWRADKGISGSVLHDWGAHFIDWILHLVPQEVGAVTGFVKTGFWNKGTLEDHGHAVIRFKNGVCADLEISSLNSAPKPKWRILGTKGSITAGQWSDTIQVKVEHGGHIASFDIRCKPTDWTAYYRGIASHLTAGADLDVKAEEARRTISIIEAALRSAESGVSEVPKYR